MIRDNKETKKIYLDDYKSRPIYVDMETFERLTELVEQGRVCRKCGKKYDDTNPRVSQNMCYHCYIITYPDYVYVEKFDNTDHCFYSTRTYMIHVSYDSSQDAMPQEHKELSLKWHGFTLPVAREEDGSEIYTNTHIYGDIKGFCVVVKLTERSVGNREYLYLCHNDGRIETVTRRSKIYQTAKKEYEANTEKYSRWESGVLEHIAENVSKAG